LSQIKRCKWPADAGDQVVPVDSLSRATPRLTWGDRAFVGASHPLKLATMTLLVPDCWPVEPANAMCCSCRQCPAELMPCAP